MGPSASLVTTIRELERGRSFLYRARLPRLPHFSLPKNDGGRVGPPAAALTNSSEPSSNFNLNLTLSCACQQLPLELLRLLVSAKLPEIDPQLSSGLVTHHLRIFGHLTTACSEPALCSAHKTSSAAPQSSIIPRNLTVLHYRGLTCGQISAFPGTVSTRRGKGLVRTSILSSRAS
jgi:hypothetical protein